MKSRVTLKKSILIPVREEYKCRSQRAALDSRAVDPWVGFELFRSLFLSIKLRALSPAASEP